MLIVMKFEKMSEAKIFPYSNNELNTILDYWILFFQLQMACQPVYAYFIPWVLGIAFIVHLYLYFGWDVS